MFSVTMVLVGHGPSSLRGVRAGVLLLWCLVVVEMLPRPIRGLASFIIAWIHGVLKASGYCRLGFLCDEDRDGDSTKLVQIPPMA